MCVESTKDSWDEHDLFLFSYFSNNEITHKKNRKEKNKFFLSEIDQSILAMLILLMLSN